MLDPPNARIIAPTVGAGSIQRTFIADVRSYRDGAIRAAFDEARYSFYRSARAVQVR